MLRSTRNQIIIFLVLFCVTVFAGYYFLWRSEIKRKIYVTQEIQKQKLQLLEKTIEFKSKNLEAYTIDYTYWDEMVDFVITPDMNWADENIQSSMPTYEADYTWVYTASLNSHFTFKVDHVIPIDTFPFSRDTLWQIVKSEKIQHFFFRKYDQIIEVFGTSIHPTNDPDRISPPRGFFFSGRVWSPAYLKNIGLFTNSNVRIIYSNKEMAQPPIDADSYQLRNRAEINGWNKKPIAYLEAISINEIVQDVDKKSQNRVIFEAIIIVLLLFIFVSFFIFKVYRPLGVLLKSLKSEDPSVLNDLMDNKNEFGRLSIFINDFFKQRDKLLQEIEERNQVEQLLIKLSQAIEQSPATIIITGVNGNIEYVNPNFTSVTGYKLDEVIGKNPRFLKPENKLQDEYRNMWETIKKGQTWKGEFRNLKKDGEIYFESAIVSPIFDETGKIINYLAVNEDITEKKHEEVIRNVIFEIAKAGAVTRSLDELIEIIRSHLSELIDVTNFYIALYNKETDTFTIPIFHDQKDVIPTFKADKTLTAYVLRTKKSFLGTSKEINQLKKSGMVESMGEVAKVWLGVPLIVEGDVIGVFSVQSYENEQAFGQKDLEMIEFVSHEITQTIQRIRTEEEIIEALGKAELSDKLKSAFLANLSHEIRTPLNSILGFTKLIGDPEIDPIKRHRFNRIIQDNGNKLLTIINNLLDFSLIETGQIKLFRKSFEVEPILSQIIGEFQQTANEKGVELVVDPKISLSQTVIQSDPVRLRQVIYNIMDNAVKFTPKGIIELKLANNEKNIRITIQDTGIGIPADFGNQAFDRFKQAEKTKARKFGGNGLGLAFSKHIVDLMGGKIWFESEEGKGTTFHIEIPYIMPTPEKYLYTATS